MHVVIHGIVRALDDAEREHGFSSRLILCFLRHLSEDDAFATLEAALPYIQDPANRIVGVGWIRRSAATRRRSSHACSPAARNWAYAWSPMPARKARQYVIDALDILHVERIDHGVRAIDDAALVKRLAAERVALTVCPLSNEKLVVYPDLRDHSLKQLLDAGCAVTLHSDDLAYFGGYMNTNWLATFNALNLSAADAHTLARNRLEAVLPARAGQSPVAGQGRRPLESPTLKPLRDDDDHRGSRLPTPFTPTAAACCISCTIRSIASEAYEYWEITARSWSRPARCCRLATTPRCARPCPPTRKCTTTAAS